MSQVIGAVLGGEPGSGKTATMVAFSPAAKRLVIDMEGRAASYRAQDYGLEQDSPERLLFTFDLVEDISAAEFGLLLRNLRAGKLDYSVVCIDNITLFQEMLSGWCTDKATAAQLADAAGIKARFDNFLQYRWKVNEPNWYGLVKGIIKEFLLQLRKKKISFVGTTEMKNKWQDYGKSGKGPDGLPLQRIVGKYAALWAPWLQVCDVVWNLSRRTNANTLMTAPTIELDRFTPKCSIVGVPPQFTFKGWEDIWRMARERVVPGQAALDALPVPTVEIVAEEEPETVTEEAPIRDWGDVMRRALKLGKTEEARRLKDAGMKFAEAAQELFGVQQP